MNPRAFWEFYQERQLARIEKMKRKAEQYGTPTDVFARINALALRKKQSPEEVMSSLANKHIEGWLVYGSDLSKGADWKTLDEKLSVSIPPMKIGETYTRAPGDGIIEMCEDPIIYLEYTLANLHERIKGRL